MDQEYKDLLKTLFGYEWRDLTPKKKKYYPKPYKNWDGKDEPEMGIQPYDGKDESYYYFKPPIEMLYRKDEERFNML